MDSTLYLLTLTKCCYFLIEARDILRVEECAFTAMFAVCKLAFETFLFYSIAMQMRPMRQWCKYKCSVLCWCFSSFALVSKGRRLIIIVCCTLSVCVRTRKTCSKFHFPRGAQRFPHQSPNLQFQAEFWIVSRKVSPTTLSNYIVHTLIGSIQFSNFIYEYITKCAQISFRFRPPNWAYKFSTKVQKAFSGRTHGACCWHVVQI